MCGLSLDGRRWSPDYEEAARIEEGRGGQSSQDPLRGCTLLLIEGARGKPRDLLLVDDPRDIPSVEWALVGAFGKAKVVAVAFDPLQLRGEIKDTDFNQLVKRHGVEVIRLDECYRQREVLGAAAKRTLDVLAKSSAYFLKEKTEPFLAARSELFSWANDIRFVYPGGSERVVTKVTRAAAEADHQEPGRPPCSSTCWCDGGSQAQCASALETCTRAPGGDRG